MVNTTSNATAKATAKEKILVTGVAGFLGSHLAEKLLGSGYHVIGVDNLSGGYLSNVPAGVEFYNYDLVNIAQNRLVLKGVSKVFHAAAFAYDGASVFAPFLVNQNVYSNTVALASAAVENGVERFIYFSSMSRYGQQKSKYVEDMQPSPVTPYGIAKYAAELTVRNLCEHHEMEYVICVPHNIIGPRQRYDDPFRNVAAIMINRMLLGQQPIIYGRGEQVRCFSFIQDCIQVLEQFAKSPSAKNEVFNIGPDEEEVSLLQLAEEIADIIDFKLDPIFVDPRPGDLQYANCSSDKIKKTFGYQTQFSLRQGLNEMVKWVSERGPRAFSQSIELEIRNKKLPAYWRERVH